LIWLIFLPAIGYQCLAIFAAVRHLRRHRSARPNSDSTFKPAVSVLKPVYGLDRNTYGAFVSQIQQDYPEFEVLFGARDEHDPAIAEVRRLVRDFPEAPVRLIIGAAPARNGKVGVLTELARHARHPVWVVNDSDIKVTRSYLAEIVSTLDGDAGLVTCLYRPSAHNVPAAWEALGISADFMPSILVAQLVGVREFGLGSTLAFRADDLERAGGFAAVADYLADDYQLAKRISELGKTVVLSAYTVETSINVSTWGGVWNHQLRWARTVRVTKASGHVGLPVAHAGLWAVIAVVTGAWLPAFVLIAARITSALVAGWLVLRCRVALALCWLSPVWDLYAFALWVTSYASREVRWRDRTLKIDKEGRIRL